MSQNVRSALNEGGHAEQVISFKTMEEQKMALNITVHSRNGEHDAHSIEAGRHTLIADRPETFGGADLGPGPYSYLLASLGT